MCSVVQNILFTSYKIPGTQYLVVCIYTVECIKRRRSVVAESIIKQSYLHPGAAKSNVVKKLSVMQMDLVKRIPIIIIITCGLACSAIVIIYLRKIIAK